MKDIIVKTIDLSDEIPVEDWENWLSRYGNVNQMECIGKNRFRPVYQFIMGICEECGKQARKIGTTYSFNGITLQFCHGSYKEGAIHDFILSDELFYPIEGANIAKLGSFLPTSAKADTNRKV